jgi:glycosyltransferase involved in cell wall biosynthesis
MNNPEQEPSSLRKASNIQIRVLYITYTDKIGERFNCFSHREILLTKWQVRTHFLVWHKDSEEDNVETIASWLPFRRYFRYLFRFIESILSLQSLLFPFWLEILFRRSFWKADLVHFHLLHNQFFSLLALPILSRLKPCVLTVHDPWLCTGHCVHPLACQQWLRGCGKCPDLARTFSIRSDNTTLNWKLKQLILKHSRLRLIVATEWMKAIVQKSPITENKHTLLLPFGINAKIFNAQERERCRADFGISEDSTVIMFRAENSEFKGISYILDVVSALPKDKRFDLVVVGTKGLVETTSAQHQLHDMGWVSNDSELAYLFKVADLFLMPSIAESFGFMALEAAACGALVITFQDTATASIDPRTDGSVWPVPYRNRDAFTLTVLKACQQAKTFQKRSAELASFFPRNFSLDRHLDSLKQFYQETIQEHQGKGSI